MDIYEFMKINPDTWLRPRIFCKDGESLSVQASDGHYCRPRECRLNFYSLVEVGYPSVRPPLSWRKYFDGEWQKVGFWGYLARLWKERRMIVFGIKMWITHRSTFSLRYHLNAADNATQSVYAYIPIELVDEFIEGHGGIDEEKTFSQHDK